MIVTTVRFPKKKVGVCLCVVTHVQRERSFPGAKLLDLGLHEAGTVAAHGWHCLSLPLQGKELGHARLLTTAGGKKNIIHRRKLHFQLFHC